jgi:2-hydroxychromene-2-carboxylate isomerase
MTAPQPTSVDFHFDVMCPYAYQTSKWIRDVRSQLGIEINWRFFSLEEVNRVEGKKHPWEREWSYGWSLLRIAALLRRQSMDDVDRWYELTGRELHEHGNRPHRPEVARHLMGELGLDPEMVDQALADPTTHDDVKADHARVIDAGGYGVPTLFFGEHCLFGPVLIDPPTGDAAVRLWHAVTAWTEFPDLFELQQPKTKAIEQRITDSFATYLAARDWVSINRGVEVGFTDDGIVAVGRADRDRSTDQETST